MQRRILFNHIPKTGGTTLRVIFNKVYGSQQVYHIPSTQIPRAILDFKSLGEADRRQFKIISGHGAWFFKAPFQPQFSVSIVREPLALFISQYHYLKKSKNAIFQEQVAVLDGIEAYIDFALEHGQDNLLTRFMAEDASFLAEPQAPILAMEAHGDSLLKKAKAHLKSYDAVLDLKNFDKGIFALSQVLNWNYIPLYRPQNTNKSKPQDELNPTTLAKLKEVLKFDIALYNYFISKNLDFAEKLGSSTRYWLFEKRQKLIRIF